MGYRLTKEEEAYFGNLKEELESLIITLCKIPAPSHKEDKRAAFCKKWLEDSGLQKVWVDPAKNVIAPIEGRQKGPYTVVMAHMDTVFPDLSPMEVSIDEHQLRCPGVGDDTANLAILMLVARYLATKAEKPESSLLFVANSCEEGLGNLKGCKQIMEDFSGQIREVISLDGSYPKIVNRAVGSKRYQVTVKTEGGHSYAKFGSKNAIHYLASLINTLYTLKVPEKGISSYNVGVIKGGTSVNTIAQQAQMLFEYRSDERESLEQMDTFFLKAIESYRAMGIVAEVKLLGERPCMGAVDAKKQIALEERAKDQIRYYCNMEPTCTSGSTDCNVPFSMGIPSVCFGGYLGGKAHTREEYLLRDSLRAGLLTVASFVIDMAFGIENN